MSNIHNPQAGGGGGGSGTVTSVAGGVGITNVPEPIVGAGTVNLDIDSLTAESVLVAGDEFAFVDVSAAGSAIAQQRKVTFANLSSAIASSLVVTCAMAPDLLCLDGRPGTTNDPILTTSDGLFAFGSIYGCSGDPPGIGLNLNASTHTTLGPFALIQLNTNIDTWEGTNALLAFGTLINPAITLNDSTAPGPAQGPVTFLGFAVGGVWTVGDDSLGGPTLRMFALNPTIQNVAGVDKHLLAQAQLFQSDLTFLADNGDCDTGTIVHHGARTVFSIANGGTITSLGLDGVYDFDAQGLQIDAGVALTEHVGFDYFATSGGGTVQNDVAFRCTDGTVVGSVIHASFSSSGDLRQFLHAGQALFGAAIMQTNASIGLELRHDSRVFVPSRITDTAESALTDVEGEFYYNSTDDEYRGFKASTRVSFITDDGAGNVTILGKLTVVGAIDPTDITYTGQLISTVATGTAPIDVTSTTICPNLNAEMVGGLASTDLARLVASDVKTGQTANVGATTLVASAAAGRYRLSAYAAVTTPASVSSTLPSVALQYTDPVDSVVRSIEVTLTTTGNTTATVQGGSVICDAKAATAIQYSTSGYASTAAGMAFKLYVVLEAL